MTKCTTFQMVTNVSCVFAFLMSYWHFISSPPCTCTLLYSYLAAICKDSPNGAVQIEKSCGRYWLCVGGYPRLQRCPDALAFNPTTLRCELATTVAGCEPPPTTPSSDTSEDSSNGGSGGSEGESGGSSSSSNSATSSPPLRSVRPSPQQASVQPQQGSQPQGALPPPFRPSQPGVRLVGR